MLTCPICMQDPGKAYFPETAVLCRRGKLQGWTDGGPVEWTFRIHVDKILRLIGDRLFVRRISPHPRQHLHDDSDVPPEDALRVYDECLQEAWADWILES